MFLRGWTSRQSRSCVEEVSTALFSPTDSHPPPKKTFCFKMALTSHHGDIRAVTERWAEHLLQPLPWRGEEKNIVAAECLRIELLLLQCITVKPVGRVSCAGGGGESINSQNRNEGTGPCSHTDSSKSSGAQEHQDRTVNTARAALRYLFVCLMLI